MIKKQFLTLLSTAAISAVGALSVPVTAVVAAPERRVELVGEEVHQQRVHRAARGIAGVCL